jgi:hypothetical protein
LTIVPVELTSRLKATAILACMGLAACSGANPADGRGEPFEPSGNTPVSEVEDGAGGLGATELGTAEQPLSYFDYFDFESSCADPDGTNSVMAALAVATAAELKRWQPIADFGPDFGYPRTVQLTSTGKAQCADRRCSNTQALLDLQRAPSRVRIAPNVYLDPAAFRRAMWYGGLSQFWSSSARSVPAHKLQLMSTAPGGCDQFFWFKATTPTGGALSSSALYSLQHMLVWADADTNPYINYQVDGPLIGIDPTYGLNQTSTASNGSCSAACLQVSTASIAGSCCSCGGVTKTYKRSSWSATTYLCQ